LKIEAIKDEVFNTLPQRANFNNSLPISHNPQTEIYESDAYGCNLKVFKPMPWFLTWMHNSFPSII